MKAVASARRLQAHLWLAAACGPGGAGKVCLGAVPDTAELVEYVPSLLSGPLTVTSKEAGLLCGGTIKLLGRDVMVLGSRPLLCSSVNRLMTSNCSSGALSSI